MPIECPFYTTDRRSWPGISYPRSENRTYRHLFTAQVIALIGSGLATVALALLAYEMVGSDAGAVLGTALAIKMIVYVGVAPMVGAFADRLPRRTFLVAMDMVRAGIA